MMPGMAYTVSCKECGERYKKGEPHDCDPETAAAFQIKKLDREWETWLKTKEGEFAVYYAESRRPEYVERLALEVSNGGAGSSGVSTGEEASAPGAGEA
jgi:hypothetical protein